MSRSLTTQLGSPVSGRRVVWASAVAVATLAGLLGGKKGLFDSVMISAFVLGFATCLPLGLESPQASRISRI